MTGRRTTVSTAGSACRRASRRSSVTRSRRICRPRRRRCSRRIDAALHTYVELRSGRRPPRGTARRAVAAGAVVAPGRSRRAAGRGRQTQGSAGAELSPLLSGLHAAGCQRSTKAARGSVGSGERLPRGQRRLLHAHGLRRVLAGLREPRYRRRDASTSAGAMPQTVGRPRSPARFRDRRASPGLRRVGIARELFHGAEQRAVARPAVRSRRVRGRWRAGRRRRRRVPDRRDSRRGRRRVHGCDDAGRSGVLRGDRHRRCRDRGRHHHHDCGRHPRGDDRPRPGDAANRAAVRRERAAQRRARRRRRCQRPDGGRHDRCAAGRRRTRRRGVPAAFHQRASGRQGSAQRPAPLVELRRPLGVCVNDSDAQDDGPGWSNGSWRRHPDGYTRTHRNIEALLDYASSEADEESGDDQ